MYKRNRFQNIGGNKMNKSEEYLKISEEIVNGVGGMDNIQGSAHCATRLRIVLKDNDKADMEKLENINKVKGAFVAGNQLQLIFGAGTVNDVYEVFAKYTHTENMSLGELKEESAKKQNPVQAVVKALSDVFIGIMPALLAAALLMGLTGVLGGLEVVQKYDTLYAINKLVSLASNGIFSILPMAKGKTSCVPFHQATKSSGSLAATGMTCLSTTPMALSNGFIRWKKKTRLPNSSLSKKADIP